MNQALMMEQLIETAVSAQRLTQLNQLIPEAGMDEMVRVMDQAIAVGYDICQSIKQKEGWDWPEELAKRLKTIDIKRFS